MSNDNKHNICQYWNEHEPVMCAHWNNDSLLCEYEGEGQGDVAEYAPRCNFLGTQAQCSKYDGEGEEARCILPDPSRHVVNRSDGKKWFELPDGDGEINFDRITGYNDGKCDGEGTGTGTPEDNTTCSGYSPYIMQFGVKQPDDSLGTAGVDADGLTAIIGVRLPLGYEIYNMRADISKCRFWNGSVEEFSVDEAAGGLVEIDFKCTQQDEVVKKYSAFKFDKDLNMVTAPCNGAKPECPHYTGVCWEYCIDSKMRHGDKVLAEQILELRWHIKKESWDPAEYKDIFAEPSIYAWNGTTEPADDNPEQLLIPAIETYIQDFDTFGIEHREKILTEGLPSDDYDKGYPTLVRRLKELPLSPIIRNRFDKINNVNVFEVKNLDVTDEVLLVGDTFDDSAPVYAINLSDPELDFFPKEFDRFDSMYAIQASKGESFDDFYKQFVNKFNLMMTLMPEKLYTSETPASNYMFYIPVATFFGENVIIVLSKIKGRWEYDKIELYRPYVGGVVAQTKFSLLGDGKEVNYLPAYENDFGAYNNNNGEIEFKFLPIVSQYGLGQAEAAYAYIDGVRERIASDPSNPPDNITMEFTYTLYKTAIDENIEIPFDYGRLRFFGNAGYCYVFLHYTDLHSIIKPWEIDGDIYLMYPDGTKVDMVVHEKCTDRLPVNCLIIRPKDINEFSAVCDGTYLYIEKISIYERRTFDSLWSDTEEVRESFLGEDDIIVYRTSLELSGTGSQYTLRKFGYDSLMAAIVYKGPTGRIIGQTKTKLITWVRQPYCRDVEINYSWKKAYRKDRLYPTHWCIVNTSSVGITTEVKTETIHNEGSDAGLWWRSYTPRCGDHELSFINGLGPMWYPYDDCDEVEYYRSLSRGATAQNYFYLMEMFTQEGIDKIIEAGGVPHGSHDMRMLGPADSFGYIGESIASIWNCRCDWIHYNDKKQGNNVFTGYGRYRGGLSELDKLVCIRNHGVLPRFGNVYRDFLRSYRSIDNIYYYYWTGQRFNRKNKWVPMYEFYSSAFTEPLSNYPYELNVYSDYIEDNSTFMHPFGFFRIDGSIEKVPINEKLYVDNSGNPVRLRFEEVFRTHYLLGNINYPMPKNPELVFVGGAPVPIMPWYTYRDFPEGTEKSIQWAWQEYWEPLDRQDMSQGIIENIEYDLIGNHPTLDFVPVTLISAPYSELGGAVSGRHAFLSVDYPNYRYDGKLKEHRLTCDEGDHILFILPPLVEDEQLGNYGSNPTWSVQLNEGPARCFTLDGDWVIASASGCESELYNTCTTSPWVEDITIFDTGYDSTEPDPDRTITTSTEFGDEYTYYQRGLNVSIRQGSLGFLPKCMHQLDEYDIRVSATSPYDGLESPWAYVDDTSAFFPGSKDFEVEYPINVNEVIITFSFSYPVSIGAVCMQFGFGAVSADVESYEPGTIFSGSLYHLPGVTLYSSNDDISYTKIYDMDSMKLAIKNDAYTDVNCFYEMQRTAEMLKPFKYLKAVFRLNPTTDEINDVGGDYKDYFFEAENNVYIKYLYVYYNEFLEAVESIKTHERLYNISYGTHGDFPPHGYDSTGSLLYPLDEDKSTVYQRDALAGVVGMPNSDGECKTMNKVRGRLLKECHPDKEPLEGTDLHEWEEVQKDIHDEIALKTGSTSITLVSTTPPNMQYLLDKAMATFPTWSCTMVNTIVAPLMLPFKGSSFSPCGHEYTWGFHNMTRQRCGAPVKGYGWMYYDTFEYYFRHVCGEGPGVPNDWVVLAYYNSLAHLLIGDLEYQSNSVGTIAGAVIGAYMANLTNYTHPGPVTPIH